MMKKSNSEWQRQLSKAQYHVLRQKGTEAPFRGKYTKYDKEGMYHCAGCNTPLYTSSHKFDSKSGWPAFYDNVPGAVRERKDQHRTEIVCSVCDGHLGHVFKDEGFQTPTDERHCVNSIALQFQKVKKNKKWFW